MKSVNSAIYIHNMSLNDVLLDISQCQYFSEMINKNICLDLSNKIYENDKTSSQLLKVIQTALKKQEKVVSFYVFKDNETISIYSDFFGIDGAFDFSKKFFKNNEKIILCLKIINEVLKIEIRKSKNTIFTTELNYVELGERVIEQVEKEVEFIKAMNVLSSSEILFSLTCLKDFLKNISLSSSDLKMFLKKCTHKENYIL